MLVRMVVSQFGIPKTIPKDTMLTVRRMGDGYQVITGEFAGKHIEPGKCIEEEQETGITVAEWNEREQGYLKIINDLETENKHTLDKYSELANKYEQLMTVHKYFIETAGKALDRIHELKQEKEPQNG